MVDKFFFGYHRVLPRQMQHEISTTRPIAYKIRPVPKRKNVICSLDLSQGGGDLIE